MTRKSFFSEFFGKFKYGVQKERNMETHGLTDALVEHIVSRKACDNPVTTFFRRGPFTAMPDEKWMDGDIAFARDRGMR